MSLSQGKHWVQFYARHKKAAAFELEWARQHAEHAQRITQADSAR